MVYVLLHFMDSLYDVSPGCQLRYIPAQSLHEARGHDRVEDSFFRKSQMRHTSGSSKCLQCFAAEFTEELSRRVLGAEN